MLTAQPVVVPVLRAGLGFLHAAQELLPNADVGFIGVARDEKTFQPKSYVNKLPENAGRPAVHRARPDARHRRLAGAHVQAAHRARRHRHDHRRLRARRARGHRGCSRSRGLDLAVYTAALDERLNDNAFIVPGLGDAGDRQFGSPA